MALSNQVVTADTTALGVLLSDAMNAVVNIAYSLLSTIVSIFNQAPVLSSVATLLVIGFIGKWVYSKLARH